MTASVGLKNVNVTHPGGDGNPGARKKRGQPRSLHICTHPKRMRRRERAAQRLSSSSSLSSRGKPSPI